MELKIWTLDEMKQAVRALKPRLAVFDCDGTLWGGDAGMGFMDWSLEQGLVSRSMSDWINARYRLYKLGEVDETTICGEMVQMYTGLRESEMRSATAVFYHQLIKPTIFPTMVTLIEELQNSGTELWAVSSTNNWAIEEAMKQYGIPPERILATEVRIVDGFVTSELIQIPSGDGKRTALIQAGIPAPDAVFGNSIHDLAMLKMAKQALPINPSEELREAATEAGWPVYLPIERS
jgi:phosphoserine phosphatase